MSEKQQFEQPASPWPDRMVMVGLSLLAFTTYAITLAPTVLPADAGEFQFVPWLPGIAHPTGYPLYILLGWLWTHLFRVGEVAWRMNLLSAVFAAVAVGLTYDVARHLVNKTLPDTPVPAQIIAAVFAAATFAVTPTFWSQAIIAEVYTLHALFVALILRLALATAATNLAGRPAKLLSVTIGLGLTHHSTTVLLLPAIAFFLFVCYRQNPSMLPATGKIKLGFTHLVLFAAPFLLYLYLPLIARLTPYATLSLSDTQTLILYDNSLTGFWRHITGSVFAGELQPEAVGLARFLFAWQLLLEQVGWVGLFLATVGLITLAQRRRYELLLLTGLAALLVVAFNLIYFIGDIFVLFIPVWLIVCLWIGTGSLGLAHWLARSFVRSKTRLREGPPAFANMEQQLGRWVCRLTTIILLSIGLLASVGPAVIKNSAVSQRGNTTTRDYWQVIMAQPIPAGAILMSNDRNDIMPMWYYQYVAGWRPDLVGLFPLIVTDGAYANVGRVLDQALASQRPVYFIKPMHGLNVKANFTPTGTLILAESAGLIPEQSTDLVFAGTGVDENENQIIKIVGYDLSPNPAKPGHEVAVTLYWQPVQTLAIDYTSFVHVVNSAGQGVTQNDHRPGGNYYPSSYWQPGETLRDQHRLTLPTDLPVGTYGLQVGLYHQPEPGVIRELGRGQEIGLLVVASE